MLESILSENDRVADDNRARLDGERRVGRQRDVLAGRRQDDAAEAHARRAAATRCAIGVLEGDIATSLDADELGGLGAAISLVNTSDGFGGECHLDAVMVRSGLGRLPLDDLDLLFIENVGNLVCPAEFNVGEHAKAMVYAVTEGEEKPLKYPVMFRAADVVVVNKIDLLPHLDFDLDLFLANLEAVNPEVTVIQASARTGEGVDEWCDWLRPAIDALDRRGGRRAMPSGSMSPMTSLGGARSLAPPPLPARSGCSRRSSRRPTTRSSASTPADASRAGTRPPSGSSGHHAEDDGRPALHRAVRRPPARRGGGCVRLGDGG